MNAYPLLPLREVLEEEADEVVVNPLGSYRIAGVLSFGKGLFFRSEIAGSETKYKTLRRLHTDQFVMSRLKAFEGAVAVVGDEFKGAMVSAEFPTFRIREQRANPRYIDFVCRWPGFWQRLQGRSKGVGARRERVHSEDLLSIEVPIPDLDAQRRLASKLGVLDGLAHDIQMRAEQAETLTFSLRWSLLRRTFERLSDRHGSVPVTQHVEVNPETVDPSSAFRQGSFKYVDIGSVEKGTGRITDTQQIVAVEAPSRARRRIRAGDVIVSTVRPNLRGSALVPPHLDGQVCSTGFAVLRPKPTIRSEFLAWQVLSDTFVEQLVGSTRGGHYPAVPDRQFRAARIVAPAEEGVQEDASARLGNLMKLLDDVDKRRRDLDQLREAFPISVLNSAFEGRL